MTPSHDIPGMPAPHSSSPDLSLIELLFISRDNCHLCDEALEVVEEVRRQHPFALTVVKIREGDEWYDRYRELIPAGVVNGRMIFKYRITAAELLAKLRARTPRGNPEPPRSDG